MRDLRIFVPPNELAFSLQPTKGKRQVQWYFGSKCASGCRCRRFRGIEATKSGKPQIAEEVSSILLELGGSLHCAASDVDVASLEDTLRVAALSNADHGPAQKLCCGDVLRKQPSDDWQQRLCYEV